MSKLFSLHPHWEERRTKTHPYSIYHRALLVVFCSLNDKLQISEEEGGGGGGWQASVHSHHDCHQWSLRAGRQSRCSGIERDGKLEPQTLTPPPSSKPNNRSTLKPWHTIICFRRRAATIATTVSTGDLDRSTGPEWRESYLFATTDCCSFFLVAYTASLWNIPAKAPRR